MVKQPRKSKTLNVYVNHFPEWTREMRRVKPLSRNKGGLPCPKCGSGDTRKAQGLERLIALLFRRANARCCACNSRFHVTKTSQKQSNPV